MNNDKIVSIVDCIEEDLRALVEETGKQHISCFILDGRFRLTSFEDENGQTVLDFFRRGAENE